MAQTLKAPNPRSEDADRAPTDQTAGRKPRATDTRLRPPYYLLLPSLALLALIVFLPMLFAFYISLTSLNQYSIGNWLAAPFVGLRNYLYSLSPRGPLGGTLLNSIKASLLFSLLTTLLITPIGVAAALLLNGQIKGRGVFRVIVLLPYIIPTFVNGIIWRLVFMSGWGVADRLLAALHLGSSETLWLIGPRSLWAMIIADVWASWPFIYLMVLAALQTIPSDLYDAAALDGTNQVTGFRYITLPLIWPTLSLALLLSTINHLNNFTLPFVMFGTSPPDPVNVLPLNVYIHSFITFNFGLGAAMSVVMLIVVLTPAIFYMRATRLGEVA